MALRASNLVKSMMLRARGTTTFATSTSPKMKAYAPAADHGYAQQDPKSNKGLANFLEKVSKAVKGDFLCLLYISLGMIALVGQLWSVYCNQHQRKKSSQMYPLEKSNKETLPELVEQMRWQKPPPTNDFIKKSFFREELRHVQDG
ncbi:hypothetical protein CTI12_AA622260 [Artemisia annua]|uniref:Uncharacterized protein n=1 Tax=Artemisia annua TaxID=35608 RepID=A0A2U1KBJ2_ARTAN|nr:hypothetical protein CTI12_AA622260 [Artemisia annua]